MQTLNDVLLLHSAGIRASNWANKTLHGESRSKSTGFKPSQRMYDKWRAEAEMARIQIYADMKEREARIAQQAANEKQQLASMYSAKGLRIA